MNYADIKYVDVANGIGVRVSLFVSGCNHKCKGCFNSEAWDFNYGKKFTLKTQNEISDMLSKTYIRGLSVLGGEPLQQDKTLLLFLKYVKKLLPQKDIWLYTGYVYEEIKDREELNYVDVLVDGPFIEEKKSVNLKYRGSENQRIIDVKETKAKGSIILCKEYM